MLTKADLVDPSALQAWRSWLREWWLQGDLNARTVNSSSDDDDVQMVAVSSYDTSLLHGAGKARHRPEIPDAAREDLVAALKVAHERLLKPSTWVAAEPERLAAWKPPVRSTVHWDELEELDIAAGMKPLKIRRGRDEGSGDEKEESETESEGEAEAPTPPERDPSTEPLTIGLVGQPNVGKSSLLNALLGTNRVRASKTPGKTKHFQTILWGARREVKIVDCPGLVCPSLVPMELQAMAGSESTEQESRLTLVLPISQIPSLPSCLHFACRHMPVEEIFNVPAPEAEVDSMVAKKTWREPRPEFEAEEKRTWTAGGIMEARALDRGFRKSFRNASLTLVTAKGGRPDANRAGNGSKCLPCISDE